MKKWQVGYLVLLFVLAIVIVVGGLSLAHRATSSLRGAVDRVQSEREALEVQQAAERATLEADPDYGRAVVIHNVRIGPIMVPVEWDSGGNVTKYMEICAGDACPTPAP